MAPWIVLAAALIVFPVLLFVPAPYGRHFRPGWGPTIPTRLGWMLMESVSFGVFAYAFWTQSPYHEQFAAQWLAGLWLVHYGNRSFVYPLQMKPGGKPTPVLTVAMAVGFNAVNAWGNGSALAVRTLDVKVVVGAALFVAGFAINVQSDAILRRLRKPGDTGYAIPQGGLYRWVSCPNYFGEFLEWVGFAIAAWTFPALAFAAFTFANLYPRARAHHRWYLSQFPDYPKDRTAMFPRPW